ncbi:MAG: hypothetical protein ACTSUE_13250 [Promethearchaeota archaeon]
MNKVGLLAGIITIPFLIFLWVPFGSSELPLYLFNDSGVLIGTYGTYGYHGIPVKLWWFYTFEMKQILVGTIMWLFPLISAVLCFGGARKTPDEGRKFYYAAFFLHFIGIGLLSVDALFFGDIIVENIYTVMEFLQGLNVGFWIMVFNMFVMILAAKTYQEA